MISFRDATKLDMPYVLDTFMHTFQGTPWSRGVVVSGLMPALLGNPGWRVTVAYVDGVDEQIVGWIVWRDPQTIGWVFSRHVKDGSQGMMTQLLDHIGCDLSKEINAAFVTPAAMDIARKRHIKLRFRPYLVV